MKNLVIVGYGGMAREAKYLIDRQNQDKQPDEQWNFLGYIDKDCTKQQVIGDDQFVCEYPSELNVVIAIGNGELRNKLHERYSVNSNIKFPNIIDPSVMISESIRLGKGNIICANSVLTVDIIIGDFNIINLAVTVAHDVHIGSYNIINATSCLTGNVEIKDYVEIGTGVKVIPEKTIGSYTVVGAGAVVICNLPDSCTAVGVPAKVIKHR